jgi:tubulin-specific chaperone A
MEDGYKKQWQLEQTNHTRRIQELQNRLVSISDIEEAMLKSKNMNLSKEERAYWKQQADNWQANNKHVYSLLESQEQAHQFRLGKIQEQAAKNEIDVTRKNFDDKITLIRTEMERELSMFAGNEAQRERIRREYQQKELDEEEKFLQELIKKFNFIVGREGFNNFDLSLLTPEQVAEFEAQAAQVGLSLQELINKRNELTGGISNAEALGISDDRDILGFTRENWQVFYDNLHQGKLGIDEMIFAASALTNLWGQYSQFVSANENAQLRNYEKNNEARKRSLKKQLDNGYINQVQYKREIEKMEVDTEKKRAELAYKQAKREKAIAIASTITGTAQAVVGALGNKPWTPFNFALASMVGAIGALNLATIAKTPLPAKGFESGLYPDYVTREQDGKRFRTSGGPKSMNKSGLYNKPTILVGEGPGDMPEMIIDKRSFARMNPALKDALIREIRTIKGFEGGYYDNMGTMQIPSGGQDDGKYEALLTMMMSVVSENTAAIRELRDKGVIGKFMRDDYPSMKNLEEAMKNYRELKQKARK